MRFEELGERRVKNISRPVRVYRLVPPRAPEARGDQKDPRLDGLFEELQTLEDSQVAQAVELQIWQLWTQSRNAAVNLLMRTGISAMERQDYAAALISFDRITGMEPDFAEGWNKRATLLYYLGDYSGSLTDIDKTLALEPRHFGAYSGRGLVFMKLERYDLARQAFEKEKFDIENQKKFIKGKKFFTLHELLMLSTVLTLQLQRLCYFIFT